MNRDTATIARGCDGLRRGSRGRVVRPPCAAQHGRLSAARHLGHLPRGARQGEADHQLHAGAARRARYVRRGPHRHRQLQRAGHLGQGDARRPAERGQSAEARVRAGVEQFLDETPSSPYTDITGGLLQAVEFLNEKQPGRKTIFIFSDLKEDLEAGYIRDIEVPVDGFEVVALNVTKLRSDNVDPREYLTRLDEWKHRVEAEGGTWRVINDLDRLETLL